MSPHRQASTQPPAPVTLPMAITRAEMWQREHLREEHFNQHARQIADQILKRKHADIGTILTEEVARLCADPGSCKYVAIRLWMPPRKGETLCGETISPPTEVSSEKRYYFRQRVRTHIEQQLMDAFPGRGFSFVVGEGPKTEGVLFVSLVQHIHAEAILRDVNLNRAHVRKVR